MGRAHDGKVAPIIGRSAGVGRVLLVCTLAAEIAARHFYRVDNGWSASQVTGKRK